MTTPRTPDNTILTLYPPRAPEATTPVEGAHYGVPKHVYDLKPMGLTIDVDPPLAGTVQPGDVIRLVLNKAPTEATKTIQAGEENDVQTLYLPKGLLLPNQLNTLVYTITRASQNIGTSTPELTLLYNIIRPGLEDRTPGDGAHSELQLILPEDVIDNGINAERAKQGVLVCFTYPYCRAHDEIRLNCNGQDVVRTVTAAEAPATPSAEPTTICVMVEDAVFKRAGDNPRFVFSYTVTDQLGNGPDTDSPYSGAVEVDVHLMETRLVAPDLAENPDDPNDNPRTIDLAKLGSKDLTVQVHTFLPQWQPNDKIRVIYTASKLDSLVASHTVEADVGRIPFVYKLMVPNAKVIAGSEVRAKYEQVRSGQVIARSDTTKAGVTGESTIELPLPFLVNAVEPIDVLAYPNGVTVRISFPEALPGDRARLVEVNAPAGSPQFPLEDFVDQQVNIVLSEKFLAARHGKVMELRWNLNRNGGQAGKSNAMKPSILKIADGDSRLPTPEILQATDEGYLNLGHFEGDAQVKAAPWIGMTAGQQVELAVHGFKDDASPHIIYLLTNHTITEPDLANGLKTDLRRNDLILFKHGTTITTRLSIDFDPNNNPIVKTACPNLLLAFRKVPNASGFEAWNGRPPQTFRQNAPVKLDSGLTVNVIRDSPRQTYYVQIYHHSTFPTEFGTTTLLADHGSLFRLEVNGTSQRMKVEFSAVHVYGTQILFCDPKGSVLYGEQIPVSPTRIHTSSYTATAEASIAYVEILAGPETDGGIWIDNILWE